jgi:hypothetical protein
VEVPAPCAQSVFLALYLPVRSSKSIHCDSCHVDGLDEIPCIKLRTQLTACTKFWKCRFQNTSPWI